MRRTLSFLAGALSLCLAVGVGLTGCGDDDEILVAVDVEGFCEESFRNMHSQGCMDNAYASVDDLKDCFVDCGPEDETCLNGCLKGIHPPGRAGQMGTCVYVDIDGTF